MDYRQLVRDVSLAALAAFTGAFLASSTPSRAVLIAAGYAAVRAAAEVVYQWSVANRTS